MYYCVRFSLVLIPLVFIALVFIARCINFYLSPTHVPLTTNSLSYNRSTILHMSVFPPTLLFNFFKRIYFSTKTFQICI